MDYINRWLGSELLMFCILPWGYAAAVASLLILMFSKKRSRQILLWVLLPQWAVVVLLLLTLQYTQLLSQTGTVWMLMLLLPILSWAGLLPALLLGTWLRKPWPAWLLCHIVFIGVLCPVMPELWRAISHQWQQQNIAQLLRQVQAGDLDQLESIHDNSMLEQTPVQAVKAPGISEKNLRALTARVASPFSVSREDGYFVNAPFFAAFESGNITAVRIFSEQLTGDSQQAQANRTIVRQQNPLEYLPTPHFKPEGFRQTFFEMADVLLRVMPDLLTDEAYSGAIQLQDKETLAFFWQRREAQNPLYRAYYFLLQGQTKALLAQIKLTPQVLGQSVYPNKNLLASLFSDADGETLRALVKGQMLNWQHIPQDKLTDGWNFLISRTLHTASKEDALPPDILAGILQSMQQQHTALPEALIVASLDYQDEIHSLMTAYRMAWLDCNKLNAMIDKVYPPEDTRRTNARIKLAQQCADLD
ncbi:hypothetical protein DFT06_17870 [Salmonella enterica]|nr:hypothetical protein [Salmonella enterica]ECJ7722686.1 hypothetical protein [Salmonella enterica]ELC5718355.1 hypothetical protein [Salmonella enterica]